MHEWIISVLFTNKYWAEKKKQAKYDQNGFVLNLFLSQHPVQFRVHVYAHQFEQMAIFVATQIAITIWHEFTCKQKLWKGWLPFAIIGQVLINMKNKKVSLYICTLRLH